ncbi:unnamed protein product [Vicia faba]|uniref:Uncharacterized protein n=1 Tax=Vicia faba TaxID=3906 RepID=A0AAV0YG81_VICFA|nr:unnamed protein product [Vicia faba]
MNLGIQKHSDIQSSKSPTYLPIRKTCQTLRTHKWFEETPEKENQPFGLCIWFKKETTIENQPFGFWAWSKKETTKENQPFGFWIWAKKETTKERIVLVYHFIGNKAIAWVPDMCESGGHPCVV